MIKGHKRAIFMFKAYSAFITAIILAASVLAAPAWGSEDESPDYEPAYTLGTGEDDWWVDYPEINPDSGSEAEHPDWILDALEEKPVLIMGKDAQCKFCKEQKEYNDAILEGHGDDITYFEIMCDGSDVKGIDLLTIYDPAGGPNYVPTMVILTLMPDADGDVVVAWHSAEGLMDEETLGAYVQDAIYYYDENSGDWDR